MSSYVVTITRRNMSTSYSDSISQIYGIHNEAKRWTSGAINIIVATSKANDLPLKINLTETLGHGKKVPRANKRGDHNCYWLPSSINENNEAFRRKHIHPLFTTACWNAGFIIHAEYDANDTCIVFKCFHSKHHNEEKQSQYRNNRERQVRNPDIPPLPRTWRKSARPVFGEEGHILCSFKLRLYYDELSKRWFLPKQQSGNPNHCGHIWEPPEHLRIQCHLAPKEEVQISSDAMNAHVPISATGSLFHERTGMTLEAHQLRYLQKQNLKTDDLLMDAGTGPPVTAMDKLLAELRSDPACHFICLYGEFNSNLLTIKTRKRASTNNAESIEEFTTNLEDTSDSPRKFAEDYRNSRSSLKDTSNGKIVLAIAWTNDEARRKMDMFPEFLGGVSQGVLFVVLCASLMLTLSLCYRMIQRKQTLRIVHFTQCVERIVTINHLDTHGVSCRQNANGYMNGCLALLCQFYIPAHHCRVCRLLLLTMTNRKQEPPITIVDEE